MSATAPATSRSVWRLPITFPHRRSIATFAWSNEPRTASSTASRRKPWECRPAGSESSASAGWTLPIDLPRHAIRPTVTVPNTQARSLFLVCLGCRDGAQALRGRGSGDRGEALSAQGLRLLGLLAQAAGPHGASAAQLVELFRCGGVRKVGGAEVAAGRAADLDLVVGHVPDPDAAPCLAGHPGAQVVPAAPAHPVAGQLPHPAVVLLQHQPPQRGLGDVRERRGVGLPGLEGSSACQVCGVVLGVPPACPVPYLGGELFEGQRRRLVRVGLLLGAPGLGGEGIAGQDSEEHTVGTPVEVLHRALQMGTVGRQILDLGIQVGEGAQDGLRQKVPAAVDAYVLGYASRWPRPVRSTAARRAAGIEALEGWPGVTAVPVMAFVVTSMNHVTHGRTRSPSASTRSGA